MIGARESPESRNAGFSSSPQLAALVHGYHFGTDDAEIYVAAVKKAVDPSLFPFGSQFFMSHGRLSLFSNLVAFSSRLTHLPIDTTIFLWHVCSIFLLFLAAWQLLTVSFEDQARLLHRRGLAGRCARGAGCRDCAGHHGPLPHGAISLHAATLFAIAAFATQPLSLGVHLAGCSPRSSIRR